MISRVIVVLQYVRYDPFLCCTRQTSSHRISVTITFHLITDSSFAIKCGGRKTITASDNTVYEIDNATLASASYYVTDPTKWGVSNVGSFMDSSNNNYIINSLSQFQNTLNSELFQTSRLSPSSLRYYGLGLQNGNYTVKLQFSETAFPDPPTWKSVGRRVFDVYIQVSINSIYCNLPSLIKSLLSCK